MEYQVVRQTDVHPHNLASHRPLFTHSDTHHRAATIPSNAFTVRFGHLPVPRSSLGVVTSANSQKPMGFPSPHDVMPSPHGVILSSRDVMPRFHDVMPPASATLRTSSATWRPVASDDEVICLSPPVITNMPVNYTDSLFRNRLLTSPENSFSNLRGHHPSIAQSVIVSPASTALYPHTSRVPFTCLDQQRLRSSTLVSPGFRVTSSTHGILFNTSSVSLVPSGTHRLGFHSAIAQQNHLRQLGGCLRVRPNCQGTPTARSDPEHTLRVPVSSPGQSVLAHTHTAPPRTLSLSDPVAAAATVNGHLSTTPTSAAVSVLVSAGRDVSVTSDSSVGSLHDAGDVDTDYDSSLDSDSERDGSVPAVDWRRGENVCRHVCGVCGRPFSTELECLLHLNQQHVKLNPLASTQRRVVSYCGSGFGVKTRSHPYLPAKSERVNGRVTRPFSDSQYTGPVRAAVRPRACSMTPPDVDRAMTPSAVDRAMTPSDVDRAMTQSDVDRAMTQSDVDRAMTPPDLDRAITPEDRGMTQHSVTPPDMDRVITPSDVDRAMTRQSVTPSDMDRVITPSDVDRAMTRQSVTPSDMDRAMTQQSVTPSDVDRAMTRQSVTPSDVDRAMTRQSVTPSDVDRAMTTPDVNRAITPEDRVMSRHIVTPPDMDRAITPADVEGTAATATPLTVVTFAATPPTTAGSSTTIATASACDMTSSLAGVQPSNRSTSVIVSTAGHEPRVDKYDLVRSPPSSDDGDDSDDSDDSDDDSDDDGDDDSDTDWPVVVSLSYCGTLRTVTALAHNGQHRPAGPGTLQLCPVPARPLVHHFQIRPNQHGGYSIYRRIPKAGY